MTTAPSQTGGGGAGAGTEMDTSGGPKQQQPQGESKQPRSKEDEYLQLVQQTAASIPDPVLRRRYVQDQIAKQKVERQLEQEAKKNQAAEEQNKLQFSTLMSALRELLTASGKLTAPANEAINQANQVGALDKSSPLVGMVSAAITDLRNQAAVKQPAPSATPEDPDMLELRQLLANHREEVKPFAAGTSFRPSTPAPLVEASRLGGGGGGIDEETQNQLAILATLKNQKFPTAPNWCITDPEKNAKLVDSNKRTRFE